MVFEDIDFDILLKKILNGRPSSFTEDEFMDIVNSIISDIYLNGKEVNESSIEKALEDIIEIELCSETSSIDFY